MPSKPAKPDATTATNPAVTAPIPDPIAPFSPKLAFETEPNSPFQDGYSIAKEAAALASFIHVRSDGRVRSAL